MIIRKKLVATLAVSLLSGLIAMQAPASPVGAVGAGGWAALAGGVDGGTRGQVMDIALANNGDVYAGGWFDFARAADGTTQVPNTSYVAKFNGSTWSALGVGGYSADDYGVCSIELNDPTNPTRLYVGGDFSQIGGVSTDYAAYVNLPGGTWGAIDLGTRAAEYCPEEILATGPSDVYMVGGKPFGHNYAIHYNAGTETFSDWAGGFSDRVFGLTSDGTNFYATGQFTTASSNSVNGVAKLPIPGTEWSGIGPNPATSAFPECASASKYCTEVAVDSSGRIYVAGNFTKAQNNGVDVPDTAYLAMWDGTEWKSIATFEGTNTVVEEVKVWGNYLYIGGRFDCVDDRRMNNLARYNITSGRWEAVGNGTIAGVQLDSSPWSAVRSIESRDNGATLYIGGSFENAGGIANADNIAKLRPVTTRTGPCNRDSTPGKLLMFDAPKNFQVLTYGTLAQYPNYNNGQPGRLIDFVWDAPVGVDYNIYRITAERITKRAADRSTVLESEPLDSSYDCWSVGLTCSIVINKDDPYFKNDTLMFRLSGFTYDGVGKSATGKPPGPYDPVFPPDPPTDVVAVGDWNKVRVSWKAPLKTGSYPITNYLVQSTPENKYCITSLADADLNKCTFTNLTPGTKYTFTVQALNGGGWSDMSAPSSAVSPQNIKITKNSRTRVQFLFINRGSDVAVEGVAPGYPAGTVVTAWVMFDKNGQWVRVDDVKVSAFGTFSWKRRFPADKDRTKIDVTFTFDGNQSNVVSMGPVR